MQGIPDNYAAVQAEIERSTPFLRVCSCRKRTVEDVIVVRKTKEGRADDRRHRRGQDGHRAGNRRGPGWSTTPKIAAVYHGPLCRAPPDWPPLGLHPRLGLPPVVCASVSPSHLRTLKTLCRSTLYAPLDPPSHNPKPKASIPARLDVLYKMHYFSQLFH